ncbi:MAG: alpha/beta hydrolase [Phycisphaerales bacterium]|nr:MAG: alpha/beta hydrolase [Phycisphaerales bacterium]
MHELLAEMMLPEDEGRVTVFVHGFNVPFESAVVTAAEIAELTGRRGLVIVYSWPAGSGSLLFGYTHDRESGEFSVLHLRRTLREIASSPDVRQLNLIAHSRGTDVLTTALREINLEERAAGRSTRETLKLGHLILAAPDLDLEVVGQRIAAEYLHMAPVSTTVYFSSRDRALGVANWLFHGISRLGRMDIDRLDEETRRAVSELPPEIELIDVRSRSRGLGHSYFHQSPEVSSDLYLILVEDRRIGAEYGRPLRRVQYGVWRLEPGYPLAGAGTARIAESDAAPEAVTPEGVAERCP